MAKTATRRLKAKPGATKASSLKAAGGCTITFTVERNATPRELRESLADMIGILRRVGGFMTPEDQALFRKALRVHGGA